MQCQELVYANPRSLRRPPSREDVERMWEVLVHLKSDPPAPRAGGAEAAD